MPNPYSVHKISFVSHIKIFWITKVKLIKLHMLEADFGLKCFWNLQLIYLLPTTRYKKIFLIKCKLIKIFYLKQ